ncbi:glycosyl hydrolase-like protein [Agrococcus casei LMG 22410]|uniref:Glycosyl hydrolase-like protein n=1 Tax=Agrococcus casei LMG 22410 TaxID=1255656 RepID=A0A1R4G9Z0_9MICO|nr:glycosyl hydrolase-like protein [Agrococcus casei LMG 22410]
MWVGQVLVVDRDGANVAYWSDAETITHWRDRAALDWGLSGVAMWTLGQEDLRVWERLAGGELPQDTKVLNG